MRFLLIITLLINSLPVVNPLRAASAASNRESFSPVPDETPTPSSTPTPDPGVEQAKREALIADELKKKAVADKDRAVAEAERLKALALPFGTPSDVQIPAGNVQTDAAGWVESQMLAHEAARQITSRLVQKLCSDSVLQGSFPQMMAAEGEQPTPNPSLASTINNLVIYNSNDLTGVELYNAVIGQLEQLRREFNQANSDAEDLLSDTDPTAAPAATATTSSTAMSILAAPGIATGIIKSVAELVNLFRTETKFENKSVTISEDMVVSHIAAILAARGARANERCNQIQVYYPALFPARLVHSSPSAVINTLNEVERLKGGAALLSKRIDARIKELNGLPTKIDEREKKEKAKEAKDQELATKKKAEEKACKKPKSSACKKIKAEIKKVESEILELETAIQELTIVNPDVDEKSEIKDAVAELEKQNSRLQALINSTDLLSSRLNTADADTKLTALAQLLRAEKLHSILMDARTFTLRVAVTANGTTKIKKDLFVDAKVRHSAGANLVYQLFNREGALAQATCCNATSITALQKTCTTL